MSLSSERLRWRADVLTRVIMVAMMAMGLRACYLALFKSDDFAQTAARPSYRTEIVPAPRGCIFDAKGAALATNRLSYEVGICYRDFMSYPAVRAVWKLGKRHREYPRRERVNELIDSLADHLPWTREQIEDFIYSEAALSPSQTHILARDLDERVFYRLKVRENLLPGLRVRMGLQRHYPKGPLAGQLIGYVGPVDSQERRSHLEQLAGLQAQLAIEEDPASREWLQEKVQLSRERLLGLDQVSGKTGIEKIQEAHLRGQNGSRCVHTNARGFTLDLDKEKDPLPGHDIKLCLDIRLQELAEQLLAQNEVIRDDQLEKSLATSSQTWIKGGSVIVMDPHTGHVLALASYPRFNPEAFSHNGQVARQEKSPLQSKHFWLEDDAWIAGLWNGQWDLWREVYSPQGKFEWQQKELSWKNCVESICGRDSPVPTHFSRIKSLSPVLKAAYAFAQIKNSLGRDINSWCLINFLYSRPFDQPFWPPDSSSDREIVQQRWFQVQQALAIEAHRQVLDDLVGDLSSNFDKMLMIELCALLLDGKSFENIDTSPLLDISIEGYRSDSGAYLSLKQYFRESFEQWHRERFFSEWRRREQKIYLKQMRRGERSQNTPAKPYLYYLEIERKRQLKQMWEEMSGPLIYAMISEEACESHLAPIVQDIKERIDRHPQSKQWLHHLLSLRKTLADLGSPLFERYIQSVRSYEDLTDPLWASYPLLRRGGVASRRDLVALIYPRYGVGYMNHKAISYQGPPGSVYKLTVAYEVLLQRYRRGYSSWDSLSPFKIFDANYKRGGQMVVGKWSSGKEISQIHRGGRLPKSQRRLIGDIDLLGAIEASSNPYFSILADQELQDGPQDVLRASYELGWGHKTGIDLPFERTGSLPFDLAVNRTGLYTTAIGQHTLLGTPIQAAVMLSAFANGGSVLRPKVVDDGQGPDIKREIDLPDRVREYLLEGMRRVVSGLQGSARTSSLQSYGPGTPERKVINKMVCHMVGKTSTAEFVEVFGITAPKQIPMHSNIWFAGMVFDEPLYRGAPSERVLFQGKTPQLVIVVSLHFGRFGKEAFPIAALLANRWREIKEAERLEAGGAKL